MLLKVALLALAAFAGSVGVLKASVALQNYGLLVAGVVLAVVAVALTLHQPQRQARFA